MLGKYFGEEKGFMIKYKLLYIFLLLFCLYGLSAQSELTDNILNEKESIIDPISIYADFGDAMYGRSPYRLLLYTIDFSGFQTYETLPLPHETGWLTAITLSKEIVDKLKAGQLPLSNYISQEANKFMIDYKGFKMTFSVEKVSEPIINMINKLYTRLPETAKEVLQYYDNNYVIRVYSAENILDPKEQEITYNEALISAATIGDSRQLLWGIHDGYNLLGK